MDIVPPSMQTTKSHASDLLTIQQVAALFRVDASTVHRWIRRGVLEAISLPRTGERQRYRIRRATVETMLGASDAPPAH